MNIEAKNMIRFEDETSLKDFVLGGKAILTLESKKTGKRYTYRIRKSKDGRTWFVALLTGNNNEYDYSYIVAMDKDLNIRLTKKSPMPLTAVPVVAIKFFMDRIKLNNIPKNLVVYHYGICAKCGRLLTDPDSIKRGIGPKCLHY
jgi:hypothetical protein